MPSNLTTQTREMAQDLRNRIASGAMKPGARLPSRVMLSQQYELSVPTVQSVMARLEESGFITSKGPKGTFVSNTPPHLQNVALILPYRPDGSLFFKAVSEAAHCEHMKDWDRIDVIFDTPDQSALDPRHRMERMDKRMARHEYSGLIFLESQPQYVESLSWQDPDVNKVMIGPEGLIPGTFSIYPDLTRFRHLAADRLKARGVQTVTLLSTGAPKSFSGKWAAELLQHGLTPHAYPVLPIGNCNPEEVSIVVQMFLERPDAPDALVIADDNLVEGATLAIQRLQRRGRPVPRHLIALFNYPMMPKAHVPVEWLGFNMRTLLRWSSVMLRQARLELRAPIHCDLKPRWWNQIPRGGLGDIAGPTVLEADRSAIKNIFPIQIHDKNESSSA